MKEDVLPEGWEIKKLENLADILDSQRKPINSKEREKRIQGKPDSKLFPYYGATGEVGKIDDYLFDEELVALGEDGVPFLDFNKDKAYMLYGKTWVNNHAHVLRAKKGITENKFLYYFLNQFDYRNYVNGGTRLKLTQANMRKIPVITPPLPEQQYLSQKLTALLDEVAQTKQRLEAIPALLKQFRQSVLADAVSGRLTEEWRSKNIHSADYLDKKLKDNRTTIFKEKAKLRNQVNIFNKVNIPEGWVEKPFFELCLLNRGFDLPTSQRTKGKYPILSAGGIIDYHNEFKVRGECVTVGRSGSVGQVFYTPKDCWVLNTALYVKDFGISIPKFVYYKLQAMNLAQYSSSTAVPTLNRNEFMFVPVTIPPKEEQTQIVQKVETYFALADEIETQVNAALENVNLLTQSILAKAFSGELSAEWRNSQVRETQGNV